MLISFALKRNIFYPADKGKNTFDPFLLKRLFLRKGEYTPENT